MPRRSLLKGCSARECCRFEDWGSRSFAFGRSRLLECRFLLLTKDAGMQEGGVKGMD